MAGEAVQSWLKDLPFKLRRELAEGLKEIADDLAADIRSVAPEGPTGKLKQSVRVRRGRGTLELVVAAGGSLTTKTIGGRTYRRVVAIGSGDTANIPRGNQSVIYDYAIGVEYGNSHMSAKPFFYSTYRAKKPAIEARMQELVAAVVAKS